AAVGVGQTFLQIPTHTGNLTASAAYGGTSVTLVANYIGGVVKHIDDNMIVYEWNRARIKAYAIRGYIPPYTPVARAGYLKSDLAASHRLSSSVSVTLNVVNLG